MGSLGLWLPASGRSKKGGAVEMIWQTPSSGSLNHMPMRSDPSTVGEGRDDVEGRGCGGVVGSSKWKRGSGKWDKVSEIRIDAVRTT